MSWTEYDAQTDWSVPALFEVDDAGEATGVVHLFCSVRCRNTFELDAKVDAGLSPVTVDSTTCEECGKKLEEVNDAG